VAWHPARDGQVDTVVIMASNTQVGMEVIMVLTVMVLTLIIIIFFAVKYLR
jgi:uncharacterized protein (UPF0333 family)